jgi:hypothetical protein
MDPASLALSYLHPLLGILRSAYDQYRSICHNQEKCLHLIKRSEKILVAIDNEIINYGQPDSLHDAIERLGQYVNDGLLTLIGNDLCPFG